MYFCYGVTTSKEKVAKAWPHCAGSLPQESFVHRQVETIELLEDS